MEDVEVAIGNKKWRKKEMKTREIWEGRVKGGEGKMGWKGMKWEKEMGEVGGRSVGKGKGREYGEIGVKKRGTWGGKKEEKKVERNRMGGGM